MSKGPQLKIKEMHFIYALLLSRCATGNRRMELMNPHRTHACVRPDMIAVLANCN